MRGIYTAGVLDVFLEEGISADLLVGVSAGAIHGCSFVSGQHGRSIRYYTKYCADPRFMSLRSLLTTGDMVGEQFCYHDLPDRLDPFDHDAFEASPMEYWVVCSDLSSGRAEYVRCRSLRGDRMDYLRASASMPFVSRIVRVDGKELLDGGACDSIPVRAAFERLGCGKGVAVLTRPAGYRKKPSGRAAARLFYRRYPAFARALGERYRSYNEALDLAAELEAAEKLLVIRPSRDLHIARMEKDPARIRAQYDLGRQDALEKLPALRNFLGK